MKTEVDKYLGWEIWFDTDNEKFGCYSSTWDKEGSGKTYSSVKNYIKTFIKENQKFKPFFVESIPSMYNSHEVLEITGIRVDGRFVYTNKRGEKEQLSESSEKIYVIKESKNADAILKFKEDGKRIKELEEKAKKEFIAATSFTTLADYKKELLATFQS